MNNVYDILPFVSSSIFSVHDSWRYQKLEERWLIAKKCLEVFNQIIRDSSWSEKRKETHVNTYGGRQLLSSFLQDSSLYQVLFSLIGLGGSFLENVLRHEKTEEALIVQDLIVESLTMLEFLLKYRQTVKTSSNISPFEDVLFSKLLGRHQVPLITSIFEFIDNPYSHELRILACRVINLIAQLTEEYSSRPPSLVGYLGSQSNALVGRCLYRLKSVGEKEELRIAMFDLISTTVEIQRGLAELFLNSSPSHIKSNENESTEKLAEGGCLETIMSILSDVKSMRSDKSKLVKSALGVIQAIFQNGEQRSHITKILRNDTNFWKNLFEVIEYFTSPKNNVDDIDIVRSVTSVLIVCAVDMYNLRILKTGSDNSGVTSSAEKRLFSSDSEVIQDILKISIKYIITCTTSNVPLIQTIEDQIKKYSQTSKKSTNLSDYILETNTKSDVLYDEERIVRWEENIPSSLIEYISLLNRKLALEEAYISLIRALHALFSVSIESPLLSRDDSNVLFFQNIIDILLVGLKVKDTSNIDIQSSFIKLMRRSDRREGKFGRDLEVLLPLPKILDTIITTTHFEISSLLAKIIHKMVVNYPPSDDEFKEDSWIADNIITLTELLNIQVQRKKLTVAKELLGCLLMYYVDLGISIGYRNSSMIMPALFYIIKNFDKYEQCTELAMSILSVCVQITFNEEQGNYICNELAECISQFDGVNEQQSKYTISVLNLLLALSSTQPGSMAIVTNHVISRLSNCAALSSGSGKQYGLAYYEGERTHWHIGWRYCLKILTSLMNSFNVTNTPERLLSSQQIMVDDELTYGQNQYFIQQVVNFCNAHKNRLVIGLMELWDKRPLTLAIIEEVELISMFVNGLARLKLLPQMPYLVDASLIAMTKCVDAVKHFHSILSKVQPVTSHERKLHDMDKHYKEEISTLVSPTSSTKTRRSALRSSFSNSETYHNVFHAEESPFITQTQDKIKNLYQGREMLNWNTQVDLTVFGTLHSLMASIRCLTVIPIDGGIEEEVEPVVVLSMQSQSPNIRDVFKCIEACADTLKIISSSKYTNETALSKVPTSGGGSITPTTLSPSFSTATDRLNREQDSLLKTRILISKVVIGTLKEAAYVLIAHLLVFSDLAEGESQQLAVRELKGDLKTLCIDTSKTLKLLSTQNWFFIKFGEMLKGLAFLDTVPDFLGLDSIN